ncbi:MAG: hypothetical protein Q7U28_09230 [Aquabacterium sp.]|nr:hypothetical protein [Aquabacterium sp.]
MVTSKALAQKIEKQRQAAPYELPKARLCTDVVLSVQMGESEFELSIKRLKDGLGNNWSHVSAFQFMSGRQAKLAAECSRTDEQASMLFAHQLAEVFCNHVSKGDLGFHALRAIALAHSAQLDSFVKDATN